MKGPSGKLEALANISLGNANLLGEPINAGRWISHRVADAFGQMIKCFCALDRRFVAFLAL